VLFGPWNLGVPVLMYNGRFEPSKGSSFWKSIR
jgi:hypothetical protein